MKVTLALLAAASVAFAHSKSSSSSHFSTKQRSNIVRDTFPTLIVDGDFSDQWEFVRRTANKWSHEGLTKVNNPLMSCYEEPGRPAAGVKAVAAGSSVGFAVQAPIRHIGPELWYMARVPDGQDADSWSPSGNVWFKIHQLGPEGSGSEWTWPTQGEFPPAWNSFLLSPAAS